MRFFCQWTNIPASTGETGFPPSIVDSSTFEPLASIVARMVKGSFVPIKEGFYDDEDCEDLVGFDNVDADIVDVIPNASITPQGGTGGGSPPPEKNFSEDPKLDLVKSDEKSGADQADDVKTD